MLDSKKIVLMGCEWYPTDSDPTKGIFFRNHAEAITKSESIRKVLVLCCSFSIRDFLKNGLFNIHNKRAIKSFHLNIPLGKFLKNSKLLFFFASLLYKLIIKKELKKYDSANIIFISQNISAISCFFQKKASETKSRHIIIEHSTGINNFNNQYNYLLKKSLLNSEFYTVSKSLQKKIKETYDVDTNVTLNNISPFWSEIANIELIKKTRFRKIKNILFVGHLIERKNIVNLIKAFISIKDSDIRLTIVGRGFLENKCHIISKKDNRIKFINNIDNNSLPYIYQENDLLILPSFEETFGVVMIEAASQGCQIASTISGGPEEIIKKINDGYIIKSTNFDCIYSFLKENLYRNYDRVKLIKNTLDNYGYKEFLKSINI